MKSVLTWCGLCLATFVLTACGNKEKTPETKAPIVQIDESVVPQARLGDNVTPTAYRLDMQIDPRNDTFTGVVTIDINIKRPTDKIWLHGKHMTVEGATLTTKAGKTVDARFDSVPLTEAPSGVASLNFGANIAPGDAVLTIPYETPYNLALNSAYKVVRKTEETEDAYIVTQFEAIGAREAFPGFDEPRFKVPFEISITSPNDDFVYANTPVKTATKLENGSTKYQFERTRPLPTYLIAFGVGPWDVTEFAPLPPTKVRARPIPLRGISARGEGGNMNYALKNTAGILEALEEYFGIPYPYEKLDLIAAPEYAFGAMENPGAIVYLEYLLLMDESASLNQKRSYARVHGHELAHQWFGDLVTPVWWEDIWLNEAFATWMGNKAVDMWRPDGNFDRLTLSASLGAMSIDTLSTTRKVREPLLATENVMAQFDGITYRKGGGVLSMFESFLGADKFQKGVRLHMKRFADDVATADDFFMSMADGSGDKRVTAAMKSFVDQPGLPLVSGEMTCQKNRTNISLTQSRYVPLGSEITQGQTWQIPVCALVGKDGKTEKVCTLLTEATGTLKVKSKGCADYVTLNADGAGYYRFGLDGPAWQQLIDNLDKLNAREILTALDSLKAGFRAGDIDADVYLNGLAAFAASSEYDVALAAGDGLGGMHNTILPASARPDLARYVRSLYGARFETARASDTVEADLLAPSLAGRLVSYGGDAELAQSYASAASRYVGLVGPADTDALAPQYLGLGLSQLLKKRGVAALPKLTELIKTGTPAQKGAAVSALSGTTDPRLAAKLRADALTDKDTFTNRQASSLIAGMMSNPAVGDDTWIWLQENFDAFVETRVLDVRKGGLPNYARGFCSNEKATEVETFYLSKAAFMPGYERALKQTLESIRLCAALKAAKGEELAAALKARE